MKIKILIIGLLFISSINLGGEKRVLIEVITNSHCPLCVAAYTAINSYLNNNSDKVDIVFYHMPFPYSDDQLYQANTADATLRNNYYGPFGSTPKALFNGQLQSDSYSSWSSVLDNLLNESAYFKIDLVGLIDGTSVVINSNIQRLVETADSDLILNLVVVEDVQYNGRNGISDHANVMRSIGTGEDGVSIDVGLNESKEYMTTLAINGTWNKNDISIVAFIQSKSSKKIYHSESIDYSSFGATDIDEDISFLPLTFALEQNYPNPFNPATNISYSIPQRANVLIDVYNILGTKIAELVNEEMDAGSYLLNFDASELTSGTYFYRLTADGISFTRKMILLK